VGARLGARATDGSSPFSNGLAPYRAAPLANLAADAEQALTAARLAGGGRAWWPGASAPVKRTILIAEDDDVVAALLEHRLKRDGFEVVRTPDGSAALEAASTRTWALGIFDVLMPGLDGFELLERVRKLPQHARTPVIMLTSLGGERDVERALHLGADDFVMKPFSPLELTARVNRLLRDA
jgi:CheY-like chemotaxis protein